MVKPKRPKDTNQRAKLIVDILVGETKEKEPKEGKNPKSVAGGRVGGLKGGKARATKLSPEKRKEIAKKAVQKRWNTSK